MGRLSRAWRVLTGAAEREADDVAEAAVRRAPTGAPVRRRSESDAAFERRQRDYEASRASPAAAPGAANPTHAAAALNATGKYGWVAAGVNAISRFGIRGAFIAAATGLGIAAAGSLGLYSGAPDAVADAAIGNMSDLDQMQRTAVDAMIPGNITDNRLIAAFNRPQFVAELFKEVYGVDLDPTRIRDYNYLSQTIGSRSISGGNDLQRSVANLYLQDIAVKWAEGNQIGVNAEVTRTEQRIRENSTRVMRGEGTVSPGF